MTDGRVYNFSAGPAVLPEPVLKEAQRDVWNLDGTGIGILEHSHRGREFTRIIEQAERDCRDLAGIPDNYRVLFLQGGASLQFAMVPMNLLSADRTADYLMTDSWSLNAAREAQVFGRVHTAGTSEESGFNYIPSPSQIAWSASPAYVHFTSNNTIVGTQWQTEPAPPEGAPLVADASSDIFSRLIDVTRYGLIYAGAQKNLGPSGVVLVIIRDDLVAAGREDIPIMLQYRTHVAGKSLYNTPSTFGIYVMGRVFRWLKELGGLKAMAERNAQKARMLYDFLDASSFFKGTVEPASRSFVNVCFRGPSADLEAEFIRLANERGLRNLKGHRLVGGMRASIYNAFPREGCQALVEFMEEFERAHRHSTHRQPSISRA
jgi:phosphoserine aminotransferase